VLDDKVIVKGFFYGKLQIDTKQDIIFQTKERPLFSGLIELFILIKDARKPYRVIIGKSNLKDLKTLQFTFKESLIKKWYQLW
jgi:hypothetical protein